MILSLVFGMTVFTSCSSDSDGGTNLTDAKYESTAAKYEIQGSNSPYSSIELTASGDYIIIRSGAAASRPFALNDMFVSKFIARPAEDTRASSSVIHGKYTKISDTEYQLEGFGTIVITGSTDNAASLEITETGKSSYTLTAAVATQAPASDMTKNLCRTWSFASYRLEMNVPNMGKVFDGEYTFNNEGTERLNQDLYNMYRSYDASFTMSYEQYKSSRYYIKPDISDMPENIIFTKTGTYMVLYANETLAVSTWTWDDESKGILRYSWDYGDMNNKNRSGNVQVSFRGNQLVFRETYVDKQYNSQSTIDFSYYMNEVK